MADQAAEARGRLTAYALIRAAIANDANAGVLIIDQAATTPGKADAGLSQLAIDMAFASARALLSANGYDVPTTLKLIDGWIDEASRLVPA
jgi:hypothetical protein